MPVSDSIEFYDYQPPNDNCRLAVSYLRLPPVDWGKLPLSNLVKNAFEGDERDIFHRGNIVEKQLSHLEYAWQEIRFNEPNEHREAISRLCVARGSGIQALITTDFWPEDARKATAVWNTVLETLILGRRIDNPLAGPEMH